MSVLDYGKKAVDAVIGATPSYGPGKMTGNGYTGMGTVGQTSTGQVKGYTQQSVNPYVYGTPAKDAEKKARAEQEAKQKAEEEAKQKAAEEAAKKKAEDDEIMSLLSNWKQRADDKTAQQSMSSVNDAQYEQLGRAASMSAAVNDDLTEALELSNEIKDTNREAEYNSAIERGANLLKARGDEEAANRLQEAGDLQKSAALQENISNSAATLMQLFESLKGGK